MASNPVFRTQVESQPSEDYTWKNIFKKIMAITNDSNFTSQPLANRFDQILETVVPSRKNPTHEKVLAIVNALIQSKAILPHEGGQMYNALLERVSKYNSLNVQKNLERLIFDIRDITAKKERLHQGPNLGSIAALNSFLLSLPPSVARGQENYLSFISALRLLVTEVPNTYVYQSGPQYFLQTTRNGSQTVNLTEAFDNLKDIWGLKTPSTEITNVSSLLTPNTRLLLLLVSPFTDTVNLSRNFYIGHLLALYRETLHDVGLQETTYNEISSVSRIKGQDPDNLEETLNFLLTNRSRRLPRQHTLNETEERILRFVQQSVAMRLMQDGTNPSEALDQTSASFEPSFYVNNRTFINRLMDYFHRAASMAPNYFMNAVLNPNWNPPEGFYTGDFDLPEIEELQWDHADTFVPETADSLSDLGAAAPKPLIKPARFTSLGYTRDMIRDFPPDKETNTDIEKLTEKFARWKTYAQQQRDEIDNPALEHSDSEEESPFAHLKPRGKFN
ncbi:pIIIa [Bovine adenovirus 10]|uniref:PIIIa n=2 Tax=Bovine adenovirus C serotype 10 TaxID=39788 RepID=A0A9X9KQA2_ADEBA|nr:pIIIa [Bovine adenovirus 10]